MPGTLIDGLLADSACKDMAPEFEEEFLKAMIETATKADPKAINGRHGLAQYQELGYLSTDYHESAVIHWTMLIVIFASLPVQQNWVKKN